MLSGEGHCNGHAAPVYVERDFRRYLEFGILTDGFARAYCAECGRVFLVAVIPDSRLPRVHFVNLCLAMIGYCGKQKK